MSNRRASSTPSAAAAQQSKRPQMSKRQASTTSSALSTPSGQLPKRHQTTSSSAAGQLMATPRLKRRASATPLEPPASVDHTKRFQTRPIMDPAKASRLAATVLPKWIEPFGAIIKQYFDFGDTSDAVIVLTNGTKHEVSSYSDGQRVCRKEMVRLARQKIDSDPSIKRKVDGILELRPSEQRDVTGWLSFYDTLTPTFNGTDIDFGRAGKHSVQGWDFASVYLMSQSSDQYALLKNGQVRQNVDFRLSKIPVFTVGEKANALQWLHRGLNDRLSCSRARNTVIYTHKGGQEVRLQGGWALETIRTACEKEWHYILMKDGSLRQAPSADIEKLPLLKLGEPTLRFMSRFTVKAFRVTGDGTVVFTMETTGERTIVKGLYYQDILDMCTRCGDGAYVLTQEGYVRRSR